MNIIKAKVIEKIKRTPTVMSFRFLPEKKINFIAGQFLQFIFDRADLNNRELNKFISFSSSPTKEYFEITKRLSDSSFSNKLKNLNLNDEVAFNAPLGNCVLDEKREKILFLIGGIGITPVISITEYILDKKIPIDIILLYSNKTEEEIAFKKELEDWGNNKNIKIFFVITDAKPKDNNYINGYINKDLISEKASDYKERDVFIFGPPKMVSAMKDMCIELGCKKEFIKTESFIGY